MKIKRKHLFSPRFFLGFLLISVLFCLSACAKHCFYCYQPCDGSVNGRHVCVADLQSVGVQVFKTGESVRLVFPSDKLFAWDSANLNDYYRVPLVDAAHLIHSYDTVSVKVAAYSDTILRANGPVDRKWALTERQAQIVANDLWRHGVDTRLISAFGYNSHYPVAWNATTAGQQQNRRVEITFRFYPKHNQYG